MNFSPKSFEALVAIHVSPALANRLPAAFASAFPDAAQVNEEEACEALAVALCSSEPNDAAEQIDRLILTAVELQVQGAAPVALSPEDVRAHPLVGPWTPEFWDLALAWPLKHGTQMTGLAAGAPAFGHLGLVETEGQAIAGTIGLNFADNMVVLAHYGGAAVIPAYGVRHLLTGDALYSLGCALRAGEYVEPAPAVFAAGEAATGPVLGEAAAPPPGSLH